MQFLCELCGRVLGGRGLRSHFHFKHDLDNREIVRKADTYYHQGKVIATKRMQLK